LKICDQKYGGAKFIPKLVSEAVLPWRTDSRGELNLNTLT
jgi:hypothetical protein